MRNNLLRLLTVLLVILLVFSCGTENIIEPEFLNPPSDLTVYPQDTRIKIRFYGSNTEDKFDGFNIYICQSSSLKYRSDLIPVAHPLSGGIPTISCSSKQVNPSAPFEVTIDRDSDDNRLENGIKYYLVVRAHSIRNYLSEPCNETSTTPRIENTAGMDIYNEEGFNFYQLSKTLPYHFIFMMIGGIPYLIAQNNNSIQSMGYCANWEQVNAAPEAGYVSAGVPLQVQIGYVFIIKTDDNRYGKIQIIELNIAGTPVIKIRWAFQKNINNKDI